jgi:hypothetical protein
MAATSSGHRTAGVPQYNEYGKPITQGAAHWVVFAGVMLILVGFFHAIEGLVALFQDDYYTVRPSGLVVSVNYTVWGWVHLVLGIVALLTGMGLLAGNLVARVVGVGLAVVSAIVNLAFVAAFPVAATLLIVFDVVIIYAIVVHGGELRRRTR